MSLFVDPVEGLWLVVTLTAIPFTVRELLEARADQQAVKDSNGPVRELLAAGSVRLPGLLLIVHVLLASVVVPGLFVDRPVAFNPIVAALVAVPIVLLVLIVLVTRDRRRFARLVDSVSPRMSEAAGELADVAYDEASKP